MQGSPSARPDLIRSLAPTRRDAIVLVCVSLAAVVAAVGAVKRIGELDDRARANAARDYAEREIAGGNSLGVDKPTIYAARSLIPRDAPYRLVIGPDPPGATSLTEVGLADWVRSFLLPRRPQPDARWVICYACDPAEIPGYAPVWTGDDGFSVGTAGS